MMLVALATTSFAQNQIKGYLGNVSLGGTVGIDTDFGSRATFQTTHGYSFGNGAFVGIGTGVTIDLGMNFSVPLYAKWTYSFLDGIVSPYVGSSVGVSLNDQVSTSLYITPELGIYIGRYYFYAQYSYYNYLDSVTEDSHNPNVSIYETSRLQTLSFGVGVTF